MKYENIKQIKKLLLLSTVIYIDSCSSIVHFIGDRLDKCIIKVPYDVLANILTVCRLLEIKFILK